jgi:tRNA(Ile)-lysidine synthase
MTSANGFLQALRSECERWGPHPGRWLVAVSGGADSVALLRGLVQLQPEFGWELIVGHFDHRLRGAESTADAQWVRELADTLRLPSHIGTAEVAASLSTVTEEHARHQRYAFFRRAARELNCPVIATAHTADDQAETVLHHLLRGTGIAGLRGIPAERSLTDEVTIVRPLLSISRAQVLGFLESLGQDYRHDATNADLTLTRNWLRHAILPELRQRWPHITPTLCRLAEQADELAAALSQLANELLAKCVADDGPDAVRLDVTPLTDRPRHLVRQVFVELWTRRGWPLQAMGYEQWNRLAELVREPGAITLPGNISVRRRGTLLVVSSFPGDT